MGKEQESILNMTPINILINSHQVFLLQNVLKIIFLHLVCLGMLMKTEEMIKKNGTPIMSDLSACFIPKPCPNSCVAMFLNLITSLSKKFPENLCVGFEPMRNIEL